MKTIRVLLAMALLAVASPLLAADLSKTMILVARPELTDEFYGATVLVVTPLGGDQHIGFILNRPTSLTLGKLFPGDAAARKVTDPVFLGGPVGTELIFALVERNDSPGGKSLPLMPGLYATIDASTVDSIIGNEPKHARFVAGFVAWQPGELQSEIERGAWFVLSPEPSLVLRQPQGLWEELVQRSKRAANAI